MMYNKICLKEKAAIVAYINMYWAIGDKLRKFVGL